MSFLRQLLPLLLSLLLARAAEPAAPTEEVLRPPEPGRFKALFQPLRTDFAALSPDGKYLAYSLRESDSVSVAVVAIDHPEKMTALVKVIDDQAATPMLDMNQKEPTPGAIRWMRWTTPHRLVVETNQVFARADVQSNWQSWRGAVLALNADGSDARLLAKPDDLPEFADDPGSPFALNRARLLGRTPDQPTAEAAAQEAATLDPFSVIPEEEQAPTSLGATAGRSLRVFDLDPARPGAVTLTSYGAPRSTGSRSLGFHTLDTTTGKLTDLHDELILTSTTALIDRQGRLRVTLPSTTLSSFPFRYDYFGPAGRNRATPLDTATGLTGFTVSPQNYFGERSIPLGFDENPDLLYYASNVGRDTYGIYSLNLSTKERGQLTIENPLYDLIDAPAGGFPGRDSLVFDRFTHRLAGIRYTGVFRTAAWLRPELQILQTRFEKTFPGRSVTILEWDQAGDRYLLSTEGPGDPGAYHIYDRKTDRLLEFVRRAPAIEAHLVHTTLPFSFTTADGALISGLVTVPRQPRLKPVPMVVVCPDLPWLRVQPDFQTEVQALAGMGFAVVQLNGRGAWGLGLKQRQSLTTGYDLVQVADLVTTVRTLGQAFNVNLQRVALFGRGHGGFIALRALQEHPDLFRCAVAIEAPVNLADWLEQQRWTEGDAQPQLTRAWLGDDARLKAAPLTREPGRLTKPVLLLNYPGPDGGERRTGFVTARGFAAAVTRAGGQATFDALSTDYMRGLPVARAATFDRIEAFLNEHIYDFKVKLRDLQILPDQKKP
jgi:pimeloyl-ACP methyl ester carboxylesterase